MPQEIQTKPADLPEKSAGKGTFSPKEPITGDYIPMLAALLSAQANKFTDSPDTLTNADLAFLLNIP